jgi:hypothetical protein
MKSHRKFESCDKRAIIAGDDQTKSWDEFEIDSGGSALG